MVPQPPISVARVSGRNNSVGTRHRPLSLVFCDVKVNARPFAMYNRPPLRRSMGDGPPERPNTGPVPILGTKATSHSEHDAYGRIRFSPKSSECAVPATAIARYKHGTTRVLGQKQAQNAGREPSPIRGGQTLAHVRRPSTAPVYCTCPDYAYAYLASSPNLLTLTTEHVHDRLRADAVQCGHGFVHQRCESKLTANRVDIVRE